MIGKDFFMLNYTSVSDLNLSYKSRKEANSVYHKSRFKDNLSLVQEDKLEKRTCLHCNDIKTTINIIPQVTLRSHEKKKKGEWMMLFATGSRRRV